MKNYARLVALGLLITVGSLTGCKKDSESTPATQQDFTEAQATIDVVTQVQELNNLVRSMNLTPGSNTSGGRIGSDTTLNCGTFTYQTNDSTGAGVITVDYGTGQTCAGKLYKGKIIFTITSDLTATNIYTLNVSAQFVGYSVDSKQLNGTYTATVTYNSQTGAATYNYNFKDAVLTYSDGTSVSWTSNYQMQMAFQQTNDALNPLSLQFSFTGGITGISREKKAFSATITSPLIITSSCTQGIVKGTYLLTVAGYKNATLDFGNGTCDNTATLTIGGQSQPITLED